MTELAADEIQFHVEDIHLTFGGINALSGVSTGVRKGRSSPSSDPTGPARPVSSTASTAFIPRIRGGSSLKGRDIMKLKAHQIA